MNHITSDIMQPPKTNIATEDTAGSTPSMDHTTSDIMQPLKNDTATEDTAGSTPFPFASSSRKKRGPARGPEPLPNGKKRKIGVNAWGQPNQPGPNTNSYASTIGFLVRKHLPINHTKFTDVPDNSIQMVKEELGLIFDLSCVGNFNIMHRMHDAWKRQKSRLYKKYVEGNDPVIVKESDPPRFVPKDVWAQYVDMCASEAFQAQSRRNTENRAKLKTPSTSGRTSMPVIRHKLALERNVSDDDIDNEDVYIKAHTKKDNTFQCPEVIEKLQENMALYPESNTRGPDDVPEEGVNVWPSSAATTNAVEENDNFRFTEVEENDDFRSTDIELRTMLLNLQKDVDALLHNSNKTPVASQAQTSVPHTTNSSQDSQHSDLNRKCELIGCPERIIALGVVADVSRYGLCQYRPLGDGYYKIEIYEVIDKDALIFRQDSAHQKIGDVGVGGSVAWPKALLVFTS